MIRLSPVIMEFDLSRGKNGRNNSETGSPKGLLFSYNFLEKEDKPLKDDEKKKDQEPGAEDPNPGERKTEGSAGRHAAGARPRLPPRFPVHDAYGDDPGGYQVPHTGEGCSTVGSAG